MRKAWATRQSGQQPLAQTGAALAAIRPTALSRLNYCNRDKLLMRERLRIAATCKRQIATATRESLRSSVCTPRFESVLHLGVRRNSATKTHHPTVLRRSPCAFPIETVSPVRRRQLKMLYARL